MKKINIHPDIRQSATLPAAFYRSKDTFELVKEKIFASCWQFACPQSVVTDTGSVYPLTLLPGVFDEPIFF